MKHTHIASTGHRLVVDDRAMRLTIVGQLDDAQQIPDAEIEAVCAAHGLVPTWLPCDADSLVLRRAH